MRLLFWTNAYGAYLGGSEIWAQRFVKSLQARGHDVCVIAAMDTRGVPRMQDVDGISVLEVPMAGYFEPGGATPLRLTLQRVAEQVRAFAPDLVQVNNIALGSLTLIRLLRSALPKRLVLTAHNVPVGSESFTGGPLDGLARSASTIVCFDAHVADWFTTRWPGIPATVVRHAIAGLDGPVIPVSPAAPLLFCGRMSPEKGALRLAEAWVRIAPRVPHLQLVMVGDGPDRPAMEALISQHDLEARVVFTGALPPSQIAAWMDRCCAIVAPSTLEGFGLSVAEAAWRGRGAVAARVGGLAANITDGVTGLLVPPADPDALVAALLRIATEQGLAERLGNAARKAIERRGDWTGHVDAFEALFNPFPVT